MIQWARMTKIRQSKRTCLTLTFHCTWNYITRTLVQSAHLEERLSLDVLCISLACTKPSFWIPSQELLVRKRRERKRERERERERESTNGAIAHAGQTSAQCSNTTDPLTHLPHDRDGFWRQESRVSYIVINYAIKHFLFIFSWKWRLTERERERKGTLQFASEYAR